MSLTSTRCAVIGHPVHHSLSPALHRAAYAALGLDWTYTAEDVEPGHVGAFVESLDASWCGLSVTMPHKQAILRHGTPDEPVLLAGAANTWVRTAKGPIVRNTDIPGFGIACRAHGVRALDQVTIVGNGATARSSLIAVDQLGASRVTIVARTRERAQPLADLGTRLGLTVTVQGPDASLPDADVVVSTVPVAGSAALAEALVASAPVVFDSVYDPWPTPLAEAGAASGRLVLNGLDLLAGQAVDQIRWMTGQSVTFELLRAAARDAIAARQPL